MKKIKNILIPVLAMLTCSTSYGQWTQKYYVDDFGDKTSKTYIDYVDNYGTFSNSATSNSELKAKIVISYSENDSLPDILFDLYEYGKGPAVGNAIGDAKYKLIIKLFDNTTETYYLHAGEHSLFINFSSSWDKNSLINYLKKESKPIKCFILIDGEYSSQSYNFKINPVGLGNALSKIYLANNGHATDESKKTEVNQLPIDTLINGISTAISSGIPQNISKYFIENIDLKVIIQEDVYNKVQAEKVLKDFFDKHPVKTYTVANKIARENASLFVIGTLETTNGRFRIYLLIKTTGTKTLIQQFRIETENE